MKKLLVFPILLVMFLLVACQNENTANENTIMDALNKTHKEKGSFEVLDVIETVKIDEDRTLVLYTEKLQWQEDLDLFIAYVESNKKNWKVTSAVSMGMLPEDEFKTYTFSQKLLDNNGEIRLVGVENNQNEFRIAVK